LVDGRCWLSVPRPLECFSVVRSFIVSECPISPHANDGTEIHESGIGQTGRTFLLLAPGPHARGNNRKLGGTSTAIILLHWVAVSIHLQCSGSTDQSQVQAAT